MKIKFIFLAAIFCASTAIAYEINDFKFASLVKKYGDGYLVSIRDLKKTEYFDGLVKVLDESGFEKYLFHTHNMSSEYITVDKQDYKLIEAKCKYRLGDRISIFGNWGTELFVTKGVKYYIQYDIIGKSHIEDIYVYVKGSPKLDSIGPIWAKNYQPQDTLYEGDELRSLENFNNENAKVLKNTHGFVLKVLNEEIGKALTNSEYFEHVYNVKFFGKPGSAYVLLFNGASLIDNYKYCGCALVNSDGMFNEWIFDITRIVDDRSYMDCDIMFNSKYKNYTETDDLLICTVSNHMGGEVCLLVGTKDGVLKVVLHSWHGC